MRNIKKLVAALRAVAVVLLLAAVVVTIYNLATTGTAWKELKTKLEAVGAETGLVERGRFDADYSAALSAAAASKEESIGARSQKVAGKLAHFAEAGTLAEDFQRRYSGNKYLLEVMNQQEAVNQAAQMPFPYYALTRAQQEEISALQNEIGYYVDMQIARWILSEEEISDETFAAFKTTLDEKGLPAFLAFWQDVLDHL